MYGTNATEQCYVHFFIDPYPTPSYIQLANVNGKDLMFTWESNNPTSGCSSLYYESLTNCSNCIMGSGSANCSISVITSIAKVCSFAIRSVVCGNIVGNKSETVNIILKGLNSRLCACMHVATCTCN
jgi:hypothetical protein